MHAVIIIWSQNGLVAIMYFNKDQDPTVKQRKVKDKIKKKRKRRRRKK